LGLAIDTTEDFNIERKNNNTNGKGKEESRMRSLVRRAKQKRKKEVVNPDFWGWGGRKTGETCGHISKGKWGGV